MNQTRRNFLSSLSLGTAGLALPAGGLFSASSTFAAGIDGNEYVTLTRNLLTDWCDGMLARDVKNHFTEPNKLLFGEGKPYDVRSDRGRNLGNATPVRSLQPDPQVEEPGRRISGQVDGHGLVCTRHIGGSRHVFPGAGILWVLDGVAANESLNLWFFQLRHSTTLPQTPNLCSKPIRID